MSHNSGFCTCEIGDELRKEAQLNELVQIEDYHEGASGLPNPIAWEKYHEIFNTKEAAQQYLEKKAECRFYDSRAVKFYVAEGFKPSAKLKALEERKTAALKKLNETNASIHYIDAKCLRLSCKNCNSLLSIKYIEKFKNTCPICGSDLRPQSTLDRIEKLKENYTKLSIEYKKLWLQENEKSALKSKKAMWLIRYEYHT